MVHCGVFLAETVLGKGQYGGGCNFYASSIHCRMISKMRMNRYNITNQYGLFHLVL